MPPCNVKQGGCRLNLIMHNVELPQDLIDFVMSRRGRLNVFADIDPATTAMLIIDMQNAYLENGAPLYHAWAPGIIENLNTLAAALRAQGGVIVWLQHTTGAPGSTDFWTKTTLRTCLWTCAVTAGHAELQASIRQRKVPVMQLLWPTI